MPKPTSILLVFFFYGPAAGVAGAQLAAPNAAPSATSAAACRQTVERFIRELDGVMAENPNTIRRYQAVLARYLFYRQGFPGMPTTTPDSSVSGCNVDELVEAAKRSKFFYEVHRPPLYQHYQIEFRGLLAKVYFRPRHRKHHPRRRLVDQAVSVVQAFPSSCARVWST